jgi:PAS domain S-box-containing protein
MQMVRARNDEPAQEHLDFTEVLRDCLACAVVAVDGRKRITAFNSAAERLVGLTQDFALGKPVEVLPEHLRNILAETFSTGQAISERQITLTAPSRSPSTIRVSTAIQSGPPDGVIAVLNDLASARAMERGMRQFDRLASIGTLSANMAHEIKNALVAVKTFVDLLLQKDPKAELAETVNREVRRIDSIVSQMLRFAGPARPTFGTIRLHEVLEHSLRLIQHQLEEKKIALQCSFAAAADLVNGDDYQLEQAFINLFFNAVEAMEPGGSLSVSTDHGPARASGSEDRTAPPQLRITIQDTGAGVLAEHLGRLFEPFFTTKPKGTGLGLPITRRIIEEHGGSISVQSELHRGTAFAVILPLIAKTR